MNTFKAEVVMKVQVLRNILLLQARIAQKVEMRNIGTVLEEVDRDALAEKEVQIQIKSDTNDTGPANLNFYFSAISGINEGIRAHLMDGTQLDFYFRLKCHFLTWS
jgi:hypothetical protein